MGLGLGNELLSRAKPRYGARDRRLQRRRRQCCCLVPRATRCTGQAPASSLCRTPMHLSGRDPRRSVPLLAPGHPASRHSRTGALRCCCAAPALDWPEHSALRRQSGSRQCHGAQFWSSPLLLPRMKPAITMSFPVPTKSPRADIGQLRQHCLTEVVDFNQGDPRGVTLASHNPGIGSRIQGRINR